MYHGELELMHDYMHHDHEDHDDEILVDSCNKAGHDVGVGVVDVDDIDDSCLPNVIW